MLNDDDYAASTPTSPVDTIDFDPDLSTESEARKKPNPAMVGVPVHLFCPVSWS